MLRVFRILVTTGFTWAAIGLHFIVCASYLRRWDKVAAVTVFPFWAWGLVGLVLGVIAWIMGRKRLAAGAALLWLVTIVIGADETRPLLRLTAEKPQPGTPALVNGAQPLRIITMNCRAGMWHPESLKDLEPWKADIIFLQEAPTPLELEKFATRLYGNPKDHWQGGFNCALLTSGLIRSTRTSNQPWTILSTVEVRPGKMVDVACVHLKGAETSMKLWSPDAFERHTLNRQSRRSDLSILLGAQGFFSDNHPAIVGGDFNAPAGDAVFDLLKHRDFRDAFALAGSGWPNTYPNYAPVLRIDHLWVNPQVTPVRAAAVTTRYSDHRMVVCDFLIP